MKYTIPDYYREFDCIASDCPATCCAGWKIVIDDQSLNKYRACQTPFGNRLKNSIDWKEKTFRQYAGRCAFLDERNLCDIYTEAGTKMLCRTCRRYPRHVEEFENEREISLSMSCPVVAGMILGRRQKVQFLTAEDSREESEDEEFDFFLYSALQDCRAAMLAALQDRKWPIGYRIAKVLALAHDVQNRIDSRQIFEIEGVLERYQRPGADEKLWKKMEPYTDSLNKNEQMAAMESLLCLPDQLEVLDESWPLQLEIYRDLLYGHGADAYSFKKAQVLELWNSREDHWMETESEQIMVYFLFTYLCGAVYDGDILSKVKMAVVSSLILRELEAACQIGAEQSAITLEDRARIAWKYSRELEHSDQNLNRMEEMMSERKEADFETLLRCILGNCSEPGKIS